MIVGDKFYYIKDKKIYEVIGIDVLIQNNRGIVLKDNNNALYIYSYNDFYNKFLSLANNINYKQGA